MRKSGIYDATASSRICCRAEKYEKPHSKALPAVWHLSAAARSAQKEHLSRERRMTDRILSFPSGERCSVKNSSMHEHRMYFKTSVINLCTGPSRARPVLCRSVPRRSDPTGGPHSHAFIPSLSHEILFAMVISTMRPRMDTFTSSAR